MEVLTEEESRLVMESMIPPFTKATTRRPRFPSSVRVRPGCIADAWTWSGIQVDTQNYRIPSLNAENEILVKVIAVGLNPIDWKGPEYNFGLPSLPWVNGRDLAGVVVKAHKTLRRIRIGDAILSPSTDYHDIRKAAFKNTLSAQSTIRQGFQEIFLFKAVRRWA